MGAGRRRISRRPHGTGCEVCDIDSADAQIPTDWVPNLLPTGNCGGPREVELILRGG